MTQTPPTTGQIRLADLSVDHRVQRPLDRGRVERISSQFRDDALGVVVVNRREDGSITVMDGQHRCAAARAHGGGDRLVTCLVYHGLDLSAEAAMFRHLNNTKQPHVIDRFRVRVVEGEQTALTLHELLTLHGWRVAGGGKPGAFSAVSALERLYLASDIDVAHSTLSVLTSTWGLDANGVRAELVSGVGAVLARDRSLVDLEKLVREMSKNGSGPLNLIGRAKTLQEVKGGRLPDAMADVIVGLYNRGRRSGRLTEWRAA